MIPVPPPHTQTHTHKIKHCWCKLWRSHSGVTEEYSLSGCDAVWLAVYKPVLRRNTLFWNSGSSSHGDTVWPWRWYDMMWCFMMIWYDIRYDMIWYMIWYDMIYDMIWYDIWYDMIYDMIWYMIYNMIWIHAATQHPMTRSHLKRTESCCVLTDLWHDTSSSFMVPCSRECSVTPLSFASQHLWCLELSFYLDSQQLTPNCYRNSSLSSYLVLQGCTAQQ